MFVGNYKQVSVVVRVQVHDYKTVFGPEKDQVFLSFFSFGFVQKMQPSSFLSIVEIYFMRHVARSLSIFISFIFLCY